MLVWLTGLSGTGKSTVVSCLRELGNHSVDADDDGISGWRSHVTGEIEPSPPLEQRPRDWLDRFAWSIDANRVAELHRQADGRPVFLAGAVDNEAEVLMLADLVVCLVADEATLRLRLATRRTNEFGKAPGDVEAVMSWLGVFEERHQELGAVMIDATRPLPEVVAAVVAAATSAPYPPLCTPSPTWIRNDGCPPAQASRAMQQRARRAVRHHPVDCEASTDASGPSRRLV